MCLPIGTLLLVASVLTSGTSSVELSIFYTMYRVAVLSLALLTVFAQSDAVIMPTSEEMVVIFKSLTTDQRFEYYSQIQKLITSSIDDSVRALLEKLRAAMGQPNEDLGLPALDPLSVSDINTNIDVDSVVLRVGLPEATVRGISSFVLETIKVNALLLRGNFGISVPDISAEGTYYLDGNVANFVPLYGEGPFTAEIVGLNITDGYVQLGSQNGSLILKNFTLNFSMKALKLHFDDLVGGGEVGQLVNNIVNDVALQLLEEYKPQVISFITTAATTYANQFLDGKTLSDMLNLINGTSAKQRMDDGKYGYL